MAVPPVGLKSSHYLEYIRDAYIKACEKHPPMTSRRDGHSVIEEEYIEFRTELFADRFGSAREEVIHLAAMCLRYLIDTK